MKFLRAFIITFVLLLLSVQTVEAKYWPLEVPNNKYGIHLADINDLRDAAGLINSTGGQWGYVTIVIEDTDRNISKWQPIFDEMRRLKIIPIVRIATHIEQGGWAIPQEEHFNEWVDFLNKLNWVVENRYVILYNEPNHAGEWGGTLNPEQYAERFVSLARKLKEANDDFYILPAGLDVSASNDGRAMDAYQYLVRMIRHKPEILELIDGWTSHSYPNPAFSGSASATGRGSVRSFEWELSVLRDLGLNRTLPVFITETGWVHNGGKNQGPTLSPEQVASRISEVARGAWEDSRIVAITPFVFNYQDTPFDHFSWKRLGSPDYYPHFFAYREIPKLIGKPRQRKAVELLDPLFPDTLVASSSYTLHARLKNTGQFILEKNNDHTLVVEDSSGLFEIEMHPIPGLEPMEARPVLLTVNTPMQEGAYDISVSLRFDDGEVMPLGEYSFELIPPPSVEITTSLGWRASNDATDVRLLVYEGDDLLQSYDNLTLTDGAVTVPDMRGVVPGEEYRFVMLIPYYLPRQVITKLSSYESLIQMKRFLPLDIDRDGQFTAWDIITAIKMQPQFVIRLFFS